MQFGRDKYNTLNKIQNEVIHESNFTNLKIMWKEKITHYAYFGSFKLFKNSIKFRKYTLYMTKFKNKRKNIKRRRKYLAIFKFYILRDWSFFYYRYKQFLRFYQNYGILPLSGISADASVFWSLYKINSIPNYAHATSISKFTLQKFLYSNNNRINKYNNVYHLINNFATDSNKTFMEFSKIETIYDYNPLGLAAIRSEKDYYVPNTYINNNNSDTHVQTKAMLDQLIFQQTLDIHIEVYKILILLTLIRVFPNNR